MFFAVTMTLAFAAGCSANTPEESDVASRADALRIGGGGCTNPLTCPGVPPPPVDPHPIDPNPEDCSGVTGTLTASPPQVKLGQSVTFSWQFQNVPRECASILSFMGRPIGTTGSMVLTPKTNATYSLLVGLRSVPPSLTVNVILPPTVRIYDQSDRDLFLQAIGTEKTTVLLKHDLELDLSGKKDLPIAAGVTIAGEGLPVGASPFAAAPLAITSAKARIKSPVATYTLARDSNHYGPRVFTTTLFTDSLFRMWGDGIKLRGFRVQGPDMQVTHHSGTGIEVAASRNVEIERMEVSGFSGAAISVGRGNTGGDVSDVVVHDCFIHNNERAPGGLGYGVTIGDGAKARIEHNVFDMNRHAIACDGSKGTAYDAIENLVLRGGGYNQSESTGFSWQTHAFDVHGSKSCLYDGDCGPAGHHFLVYRNAFQYSAGGAFELRGTPDYGALVSYNMFAHDDPNDAVSQTETGMTTIGNLGGQQTFGKYGVCDFDGDGLDDLFLATGRTWWFASGGRFHWTFLGSKDDVLADLAFGDFDRDGRCDVFRVGAGTWQVSRGGKEAWASMNGLYFPLAELGFHDFDGDGATDIFRRAPENGQWSFYSPTTAQWTTLGSSVVPLRDLRFADLDGDGVADVVTASDGHWKWSRGGLAPWADLPHLGGDLSDAVFGNFDGLPGDDVMRIVRRTLPSDIRLDVSSSGQSPPHTVAQGSVATFGAKYFFAGRFAAWNRGTLLMFDDGESRVPQAWSDGQSGFLQHASYAY